MTQPLLDVPASFRHVAQRATCDGCRVPLVLPAKKVSYAVPDDPPWVMP